MRLKRALKSAKIATLNSHSRRASQPEIDEVNNFGSRLVLESAVLNQLEDRRVIDFVHAAEFKLNSRLGTRGVRSAAVTQPVIERFTLTQWRARAAIRL
jgi:hypothetical protein